MLFLGVTLLLCLSSGLTLPAPTFHQSDVDYEKWITSSNTYPYRRILISNILRKMDTRYSPCDNFYNFACGNWKWVKPWHVPDGDLQRVLVEHQKYLLKKLITREVEVGDIDAEIKLKQYFSSCVDRKSGGWTTDDVLQSLGSWPAYDRQWKSDSFNWINATATSALYGVPIFFHMDIQQTGINDDTLGIAFNVPSQSMVKWQNLTDFFDDFSDYVDTLLDRSAVPPDFVREMVDRIHSFGAQLHSIYVNHHDMIDPTPMKAALEDFELIAPECDLTSFVSVLTGVKANLADQIVVENPQYIQEVCKLISKTDRRTVADFIFWRTWQDLTEMMWENVGLHSANPVDLCVEDVKENLRPIVVSMFAKHYLPEEARSDVTDLANALQNTAASLIQEAKWLDDATRRRVLDKILSVDKNIGFPDYVTYQFELNERYADVQIDPDNFLKNHLHLKVFSKREEFQLHGKPAALKPWNFLFGDPQYVGGGKGSVKVPIANLLSPLYHQLNPSFVNHGMIGFLLAHGLVHSLLVDGPGQDEEEYKQPTLSPNLLHEYVHRTECFVNDYSKFRVGNFSVDGQVTLNENLADSDGLKLAYRHYKTWISQHPWVVEDEQTEFRSLQLTHEQAFFVSFAQTLCDHRSNEEILHQLETGHRPPARFRILGTIRNSDDFAREFECLPRHKVNPPNKCVFFFD